MKDEKQMRAYIGKRIREVRKQKGKSLKDVSEAINYDLSSLSKVERGEYEASYDALKNIADYLGVKTSYFFGESSVENIPDELKELGVEEIQLAKEITKAKGKAELTPDQIEQIKNFIQFTINTNQRS
jgi:transcriptional regulator with XRE-family HTH domain